MATDLIPVVDLRLLSQSDLHSLSLSSPSSFDLRRSDDLVVPKIDRSVFNESAGSRKQTFSRLPLHPHPHPHPHPSLPRRRGRPRLHPLPPSPPSPATDPDNLLILSALRRLFSNSHPHPHSHPQTLTLTPQVPPQNALALVDNLASEKEVLNSKGVPVDLVGLGGKEDLFAAEIGRRTAGLTTEEQLLGYMTGLDGQWGSQRRRRKIVDAAVFGDELPRGWKVLLSLKRKEGVVTLNCRRFVSPSGKQFLSCKDVSSYILSLVGHQAARQPDSGQHDESAPRHDQMTIGSSAGFVHQDNTIKEKPNCSFITPISYISTECEKQGLLFRVDKQAMVVQPNPLKCRKCNITFGDKDAHSQHLLAFHQRTAKRRRLGSTGGGVIINDGKYECQFCHKIFSERHRYNGHIGSHVRYQGLGAEASPYDLTVGRGSEPTFLAVVPYIPPEANALAEKKEDAYATKAVDGLHIDSFQNRSGGENNDTDHNPNDGTPKITEAVSTSTDNQNKDYGVSFNKQKEIVDVSNVGGHACTNGVSPSGSDINEVVQDCLPGSTQEASNSKSVHGQIIDCEMGGDKSEGAISDSRIHDTKLNACVDAASPTHANMDFTICETANEIGVSSSPSKLVDGSITDDIMVGNKSEVIIDNVNSNAMAIETNNDIGVSPSTSKFVDANNSEMAAYKPEGTVDTSNAISVKGLDAEPTETPIDTSNAMGIEANVCLDSLSLSLINVNSTYENSNNIDLSSCTMFSAIEEYNKDRKVAAENLAISLAGNGSSYSVETYTSEVFASTVEEQVAIDASSNERTNIGICHELIDKYTGAGSTVHGELNDSQARTVFGNEHTIGLETADCIFPFDVNESVIEEIDNAASELENHFHSSNAGHSRDTVDGIVNNDDEGQALQFDVGSTSSSWVQSSECLPMLNMFPDQCEDALGGIGRNNGQENLSGFEELRLGSMDPANFGLLTGQGSGSIPRSPIEFIPSIQLGWNLSPPKMPTSVCVWCNAEFRQEGGNVEPQSGTLGFMCPLCKAKISGQFGLL